MSISKNKNKGKTKTKENLSNRILDRILIKQKRYNYHYSTQGQQRCDCLCQ